MSYLKDTIHTFTTSQPIFNHKTPFVTCNFVICNFKHIAYTIHNTWLDTKGVELCRKNRVTRRVFLRVFPQNWVIFANQFESLIDTTSSKAGGPCYFQVPRGDLMTGQLYP